MAKLTGKDAEGRQKRIEYRGRNVRISRTGRVALRAEKKVSGVNLTANTSQGMRASVHTTQNTRVALQNGRFRLIGRWIKGPFAFNLSKSGVSASVKTSRGRFNLLRPQRSSFKIAGIHVRGQNAVVLTLLYTIAALTFLALLLALRIAVWLALFPVAVLLDLVAALTRRNPF